jgi:hypothetical protein
MRAVNAHIHAMRNFDHLIATFPRQLLSREIEIGLGIAIWAGLVFVVVHFGGLATA